MRKILMAGALAAIALAGLPANAQAPGQSCFYSNQWTSWKAPDDHTIFLKVGNRVYRLDLASCPTLNMGGATLITHSHSTQICSAIDWDLKVRGGGGVTTGCIVSKMTQLTADEIAALPKDARP
jgi:Family of unknown function (DUF6491)